MQKIAIVTSEGGMSCAYSVGVLLALVEKYNFTEPDLLIGSSGSTGNLAYYASKQYPSMRNVWQNLLTTKRFINLWRFNKIMDIDFLIDDIFDRDDKFDVCAARQSTTNMLIGVTAMDGQAVYFSNHDPDVNLLEALRASSAMPVMYGKKVIINGKRYMDGSLAANINTNVAKARELGATQIILIDNRNHRLAGKIFLNFLSFFVNTGFKKAIAQYLNSGQSTPDGKDIILISPSRPLPARTLNNNKEAVTKNINIGYADALKHSKLQELLKEFAK